MKLNRFAMITSVVAAGAIALAGCGSDNNNSNSGGGGGNATSTATDTMGATSTGTATNGGGGSASGITCSSGTLQSSGSTAQANAMAQWIKDYQTACSGATINYAGGGSGQGVENFQDGTVDFAGSDFPLQAGDEHNKANQRCGSGDAVDVPMVPGAIAVSYNLPGVKDLSLSASTIAKIFSGKITKWDDPAIKKDNPGVSLPALGIQTFHRSDGSGTSFNFTNYLAHDAKADWSYGANKDWPAPGGQGAEGSSGVAQGVKSTQGGIGYFEKSYADQAGLPFAKVGNAQGKFVELTNANVVTFVGQARFVGKGGDLPLEFNYGTVNPNAYPNVLVTYEIFCSAGNKKVDLLKNFLTYVASDKAQKELPSLGYVSLPTNVQHKVQTAISAIK